MVGKYWIKLYHEILYERKIATLEDRLWRRMIECFLMAGELNQEGNLPSLVDMAYLLRMSEEDLETDLNELIRIGILEYRDESYFVKNFQKRQAPMEKAEYMRRMREERQREEARQNLPELQDSYQSVTVGNTDTDTDIDTDVDLDADLDIQYKGDFSDLSIAFCNKTKIPELTGGPQSWYESLKRMGEAGVQPQDIESAIDILRDRDYSIVRLSSIENTAISEMSKRIGKVKVLTGEERRKKYSGEYYA